MKAFCFRLEDEVAEQLNFAAQRAGVTKYTYIINTILQRLNDEEEMAKNNDERWTEHEAQTKAQMFNIRFVGQVLMALLAGQIGEEESRKICADISAKLKQQEGIK